MEYNTQVGIFETGEKDSQGGAYKDNRFLALRKRELNEYEVKDGVAIIGDRAFFDAKLSTVTLPNSLRAIGQSAFAGCKNLTGIALPEGLEVIKETAFRDCESLAELTLPSTLLEVGARAFGPGLKRLVILSENVTFSPDAFKQAKSLEEIHVPGEVIGKYTVLFLALGITAPLTEIKAEQEQEEEIMEKSGRTIRVDLTRPGIKRITMLPLDNEGMEIMKEHGNDAVESYSDIYDKVWSEDSGQLMDFVFENAYSEYGLYVVDAETEEVIYEDDSFVPDTSCGLMSYSEAEAEYRGNDPDNDFSRYVKYLRSECQTNELYLSQGFAKAWNELSEPTTESAATFIPNFMLYALSAAEAKNALLMGVEESEPVTVSFYINLPEGENFDPAKLDFINIDEHYDAYSKVLQELLGGEDIILLNAIIYDGKIYFAGHDEIDILGVSDEEPIFDYVDENIAKKKMNFYEFITNVRMSYDYYDEQEYDEDDENYLSAQLDFSELDDDEIDRFFDILGDECDFPNEALWTMVDYDGELERDSLIDIDDENAGMEILMQYPEAFVRAAHKFLAEQEGEECEEAIYGVGGYFWWGDDELEEEFFVEEITM